MCLRKQITRKEVGKLERDIKRKAYIGYKLFDLREDSIQSIFYGRKPKNGYKLKTWHSEEDFALLPKEKEIEDTKGVKYPRGFHLYTNQDDAANNISLTLGDPELYKVYYRKILAQGIEGNERLNTDVKVVVAKKIYITEGV